MRRLGIRGLEVALLVALSPMAMALAEPGEGDAKPAVQEKTVFNWMFGSGEKVPAKKPGAKELDPKKEAARKEASAKKEADAELKKEQANYLRRLAVCDQLKEIAVKTTDDALLLQAEQLEARSWETYSRRIAHLPASSAADVPEEGGEGTAAAAADDSPTASSKTKKKPEGLTGRVETREEKP